MQTQEIEAKYYVLDLDRIAARLSQRGAQLLQPRTREHNLRFDTPAGDLCRRNQVLRLRQDTTATLTYKGPSQDVGGALSRTELEFTVSDPAAARSALQALGYIVVAVYEKYRATWQLGPFHIMLDELPYGNFVEIEGPDPASIQDLARQLGLDPARAARNSYLALFARLAPSLGLDPTQLTFAALHGLPIPPAALGLQPADGD